MGITVPPLLSRGESERAPVSTELATSPSCGLGGSCEWQQQLQQPGILHPQTGLRKLALGPLLDSYSFSRFGPPKPGQAPPEPRCSFQRGESYPKWPRQQGLLGQRSWSSLSPPKCLHNLQQALGRNPHSEMKILLALPVCTTPFGRHRFGTAHVL